VPEDTTEAKPISTIEDAVESILAPSEETTEEVTEEAQETEEISAESEIEEVDSIEEEEVEASESEDDEDLIEEPIPEEPQPELHTVKADGQDYEATLSELKQSFSGQKHIQTGMQDVANKRKEAEDVYTALNNERQQLAELYQSLQNGGVAAEPVKPNKELFDADPIGYMQKNLEYEELKGERDKQMAELEQVSQQNSEAQQHAKQAFLNEQMQILQKEIPEFADEKKASKLKDQLVSTGTKRYGYTTEEVSQITDHRAIRVLHDAMKYQNIIAGKSKAEVKTKSAKPVVKPGTKKMSTPDAKIRSRQQAKLRETGRIDDAVGLIVNS